MIVTVGSITGAATTYQGSGVEIGTSQKVSVEAKAPVSENSIGEKKAEYNAIGAEKHENQRAESVKLAVEEINKKAKNSEAVFGVHDETNRITIKIVDKETKETIKEFPPEETLDMIAKVWELAGLMVDEKR